MDKNQQNKSMDAEESKEENESGTVADKKEPRIKVLEKIDENR